MTATRSRKPAKTDGPEQLLTCAEAAARLGLPKKSVENMTRAGDLPRVLVGPTRRLIRVREADLNAYIAANWEYTR